MTNVLTKIASSSKGLFQRHHNKKQKQKHIEYPNYDEMESNIETTAPTSGLESAATNSGRHQHIGEQQIFYNRLQRWRYAFREPLAEFFGVLIMIMYGDGVVAQVVLSSGEKGNYTMIAFSWATAVFLGYAVSAGVSGAHLNWGVTLSAAVYRKFPWRKVPGYLFAQFLGGYCGALIMYGVYYQAFNDFEGGSQRTVTGPTATAGVFCTFPQPFLSTQGQVTSELVTSALLQIGIFSMTDPHNAPLGNAFPFGLFVLIYGLGSSYGYLTGYAINLARDFGPRLAAATVGYPSELFTAYSHYFWVPVVIPIIGCLTGGFFYDLFIYQGLDSPLNQKDLGINERLESIRNFELHHMKPDFDVERAEIHKQNP
jgi:aquaglyceroporin related protein